MSGKGGWQPIFAPSAEAFDKDYLVPPEIDAEGIRKVATAFADAAKRCEQAGAKVVEIHAAHGYLLHDSSRR